MSLSNRLGSPLEPDSFDRVPSLVLDAGWAWAGLAVAVGCLAGSPARGALAGASALLAAASAYYGTDALVRDEPFAWYVPELLRWCVAGVALGSLLGGVGAYATQPGAAGLLGRLVVPVGAAAQMVVDPPAGGPSASFARMLVLAAAGTTCVVLICRFVLRLRAQRPVTSREHG